MEKYRAVKLTDTAGNKCWGVVKGSAPHQGSYYYTRQEARDAADHLNSIPDYSGPCDCGEPKILGIDQNSQGKWYCPICD